MRAKNTVLAIFAFMLMNAIPSSAQQKELPWYFPKSIIQTTDPSKQMKEYLRHLASQWNCFQGNPHGMSMLIPGDDSIRVTFDGQGGREKIVSTSSFTESPANLTIVLDHYVRRGPDEVVVTMLCGETVINNHQLQVVIDDFVQYAKDARDGDNAFWRGLEPEAVEARAKKLGIPVDDFRKHLDEKVPGTDVTYREYNRLPKPMRSTDFMARELHLGYSPEIAGILGLAWLDTGLIYLNPQARVADYLMGYPSVLEHEVIHNNVNLEEWPFSEGFDAELFASPLFLLPANQIDFFFHGYMEVPRELAWAFFGFDYKQARREIFKFDAAGQEMVDEAKWKEYLGKTEPVKAELLAAFHKALVEFYSDALWYTAMNNRLGDDNTAFRIVMATHYDLTVLGGHRPTMLWLEANRDKILGWARDSYKALGDKGNNSMPGMNIPPSLLSAYKRLNESERLELQSYFNAHQAELKTLSKDSVKLQEFYKKFRQDHLRQGGVQ